MATKSYITEYYDGVAQRARHNSARSPKAAVQRITKEYNVEIGTGFTVYEIVGEASYFTNEKGPDRVVLPDWAQPDE